MQKKMTYEDFVAYSVIAIVILAIILIFWVQNKEFKREQEVKKRFKKINKRIEEIRRGYEVQDKEENLQ